MASDLKSLSREALADAWDSIGVNVGERTNATGDEMARRLRATCRWTNVMCEDYDVWDTECGQAHQFETDGPAENLHTFCPYCGCTLHEETPDA